MHNWINVGLFNFSYENERYLFSPPSECCFLIPVPLSVNFSVPRLLVLSSCVKTVDRWNSWNKTSRAVNGDPVVGNNFNSAPQYNVLQVHNFINVGYNSKSSTEIWNLPKVKWKSFHSPFMNNIIYIVIIRKLLTILNQLWYIVDNYIHQYTWLICVINQVVIFRKPVTQIVKSPI